MQRSLAVILTWFITSAVVLGHGNDIHFDSRQDITVKVTKVAGNVYMLQGRGGNIGAVVGPEGILIVDDDYKVVVKWSKIEQGKQRTYQRCYGPPFILQISGSGLVAPCGMLFNERYKRYHAGNIVEERFKDIILGDRYWEIVNHLASPHFNAQTMCGSLCLQHKVNEYLDEYMKGRNELRQPAGAAPQHLNFI